MGDGQPYRPRHSSDTRFILEAQSTGGGDGLMKIAAARRPGRRRNRCEALCHRLPSRGAHACSRPSTYSLMQMAKITQGKSQAAFCRYEHRQSNSHSFAVDRSDVWWRDCASGRHARSDIILADHGSFLHRLRPASPVIKQFLSTDELPEGFLQIAENVLEHAFQTDRVCQVTQWTTSNFDTIQLRAHRSAGASRAGARQPGFGGHFREVVSPRGVDEDDRPQPRLLRRLHTRDRSFRCGLKWPPSPRSAPTSRDSLLLVRTDLRPDRATFVGHETRTPGNGPWRECRQPDRIPSCNGSRSGSANS